MPISLNFRGSEKVSLKIYRLFYKKSPPENLNIGFLYPLLINEDKLRCIDYLSSNDLCMTKKFIDTLAGLNVDARISNMEEMTRKFIKENLKEKCFEQDVWWNYVFPLYEGSTAKNATRSFFKHKLNGSNEERKMRERILIPVFMLPIIFLAIGIRPAEIKESLVMRPNSTDDNYKMLVNNLEFVYLYESSKHNDFEKEELYVENLLAEKMIKKLQKELEESKKREAGLIRCIESLTGKKIKLETEEDFIL
jgi:DNA-directed RNA polymerase beta' subunit